MGFSMVFPRFSMVFPRFSMVFPRFSMVFPRFSMVFPWFSMVFHLHWTSSRHSKCFFSGWPKLLEAFKRAWCRSGWPNKRLLAFWILIPRRGDLAEKSTGNEPWTMRSWSNFAHVDWWKKTDRRSNTLCFLGNRNKYWYDPFLWFLGEGHCNIQWFQPKGGACFDPPKSCQEKSPEWRCVFFDISPCEWGKGFLGTLHAVIWYLLWLTDFWIISPRHQHVTDLCDSCRSVVSPGMIGAPVIPSFWLVKKWWGSHVWCWLVVPDMGMGQN